MVGLDSSLFLLERSARLGGTQAASSFAQTRGLKLRGDRVEVILEAEPEASDSAMVSVASAGGSILASHRGLLLASVPVSRLETLARGRGVLRVMPSLSLQLNGEAASSVSLASLTNPLPVVAATTSVVSQGVTETNANAWHSAGFNGRGIKVGIIDQGFLGYPSKLGTELPSTVVAWGKGTAGPENGGTDHGVKVAEIIHDMAPGASLYIARAENPVDLGRAKDWMIAQGVKVINHSYGYVGFGILDGRGPVNDTVTSAVGTVFWAQAAGNYRLCHWMGNFTNTDADGWMEWDGGAVDANVFWADAGSTIEGVLWWNDSAPAKQDYDLYLYRWDDSAFRYVSSSINYQNGAVGATAFECVSVRAPVAGPYAWFIHRYSASRSDVGFDFFSLSHDLDDGYPPSFWKYRRSILQPADNQSSGFMAAGAVGRGPAFAQESYSSEGPTRDGRLTPEIVAPSNVNTSLGRFAGTSASAPHLAGAAALVRQAFPAYTPAQVEDFFKSRAIDLGAVGVDNQHGWGRLWLGAPPSTSARYQETNANLEYQGSWTGTSRPEFSGGTQKQTNSAGGAVNIAFKGTAITWLATKGPGMGKARVVLDYGAPILVDLYAGSTLYQQKVWTRTGLANGLHNLRIEWTGQKNSSSSGSTISLDALDVTGTITLASVSGYSAEELALFKLINDYRQQNGRPALLLSDMLSEAAWKHSQDMGKYGFFGHDTVMSDFFPAGSKFWQRLAACGYNYSTHLGENIAAAYPTAAQVFQAWRTSTQGHDEAMLDSNYKVIGIGFRNMPGSPYTYYWTADFGGYVDPTAHMP